MPTVSVLMPVYNGGNFLKDAVESILNQTYRDFEFLIINDGSVDNSLEILKSYSDSRIIIIDNGENKGLIYSLNKGLKLAKGEFIVRMDADDISFEDRIEKQVDFMVKNPEIGISGTYIQIFGENINQEVLKFPVNPGINKAQLLFSPCLAHPSVIIRKLIIDSHNLYYRHEYKHAEDYDYWIEAINYTKISNIPEVLLKYRVIPTSITQQANKNLDSRFSIHKVIYTNYLNRLGFNPSEKELYLHFIISDNNRFISQKDEIDILEVKKYFKKLVSLIKQTGTDKDYFFYYISKRRLSLSRYTKSKKDFICYALSFIFYKMKVALK